MPFQRLFVIAVWLFLTLFSQSSVLFRAERNQLFEQQVLELETADILDRALLRAKHAKQAGTLSAPEYYRL